MREPADLGHQSDYWDSAGTTKTFGHPWDLAWFSRLDRRSRILDFGCGYGRLAGEVATAGFTNIEGVDPAANLIERARADHPSVRFSVLEDSPRLPHASDTLDAVLLFAVLTCVPDSAAQQAIVDEIHRVLRPGGVLCISDYCLQNDKRNRQRYEQFAPHYGAYGVFETSDGAVCRHHTREHLEGLLGGFAVPELRERPVVTMNGHPATATQLLALKKD